jgi:hypothetical protein
MREKTDQVQLATCFCQFSDPEYVGSMFLLNVKLSPSSGVDAMCAVFTTFIHKGIICPRTDQVGII